MKIILIVPMLTSRILAKNMNIGITTQPIIGSFWLVKISILLSINLLRVDYDRMYEDVRNN